VTHSLAGKPAPESILVDVDALLAAYRERTPDLADPEQRVAFGTSGHRGSALRGSFNEAHILAMSQAIADYRAKQGITGPLFLGKDTHGLSIPAERTALQVLAANSVETVLAAADGFTPTPAISRAILAHNRGRTHGLADGIVVTPSHNPPEDGGFKYNPPGGGPADTDVTQWIQDRANALLAEQNRGVRQLPEAQARRAATTHEADLVGPYVESLAEALDMNAIRASRVRCAVDPLGGASLAYWDRIAERWGLNLEIVDRRVDPRFGFMTLDHDGKIRMDCSSPYAMAKLIELKDRYAVAFGNDADADRHGIVVPSVGLMNPNHYLAVAIRYLIQTRSGWRADVAVGKTLVSSAIIDRVVADVKRRLLEVPVGFKWFAGGLLDGSLCFGGEESAGASFLCRDGSAWTTDKDGLLLALLAVEMIATTGRDPGQAYEDITARFGKPSYKRIDAPATPAQKSKLKAMDPKLVTAKTLAGEPIVAVQSKAPGNNASLGGLKVATENAWFAARPSGTEDVYKVYAESFKGEQHLELVIGEAKAMVQRALGG
jgi:phosphoglucomutase